MLIAHCLNCRYHVECIKLKLEDINDDDEFFCPTCVPEREYQFSKIKSKLVSKVEELATRQNEFGGVTIDRDMFKEKKNANPYNYSQDFPPTLKDLSIRVNTRHKTVSDFKKDYKEMCKQLTANLKDDYEDQITAVEWELDDIIEEVFKEDEDKPVPVPEVDEETIDNVGDYDDEGPIIEADPDTSGPREDEEVNHGGLCDNCRTRFSCPVIYSCARGHRVCLPCRNLISGCICPCCYKQTGERKRLSQDSTSAIMFRLANATNFQASNMRVKKPRAKKTKYKAVKTVDTTLSPMIMNVWSCAGEEASIVMDADVAVKADPEDVSGTGAASASAVAMSRVLPAAALSSSMLTLIDPDIVAAAAPGPASPDQQPVNYNEPEDARSPGSQSEGGSSVSTEPDLRSPAGKVRRMSGEDWIQSLSGGGGQASTATRTIVEPSNMNNQLWERYKERARLSGGYSISVNPSTGLKMTKYQPPAASLPSGVQPREEVSLQYQPSDTGRYQTQSASSLQVSAAPRPPMGRVMASAQPGTSSSLQPQPRQTVSTVRPYKLTLADPAQLRQVRSLAPQPRPPPPLQLMQPPPQNPPRLIVIRNPSSSTNTHSEGAGSSLVCRASVTPGASSILSAPAVEPDDQFITPDQIQESFNEIEKYLVADDDNIFENLDSVEAGPTTGQEQQPGKMMGYLQPPSQHSQEDPLQVSSIARVISDTNS